MRSPDPAQCVRLLDCLLRFFGKNGQHWTRFTYDDCNGNRCLAGAVDHIERKHRSLGSGMTDYLSAAIWPRRPREWRLERVVFFNDRCKGFERIRAAILKARALAQHDAERLPEIIAAADAAYSAEKEFIAQTRKRQLLAEVERERMSPAARRITADTYILSPRAPEPEPQRLAA
jgi:hypothetical protein